MVWFKVDDSFWSHPKTIELSDAAVALWARAGSYSAHHSTDGHISAGTLRLVGGAREAADELVQAGLWTVVDDRTWEYHDWGVYQPDAASVRAKRDAESVAGARGNHQRWHEARDKHVPGCSYCESSGTRSAHDRVPDQVPDRVRRLAPESPVPVPDPTPVIPIGITGEGPRKRASRLPDSFVASAAMREWAAERTPLVNVDTATERFVNHWRAKSGKDATKLDWAATWRNWLLRDQEDRANRTKLTPTERAMQTVSAGREFVGRTLTTLELESGAS